MTFIKHKNVAPYDVLAERRGLRWPVVEQDGQWRETTVVDRRLLLLTAVI